MKNLGITYQVHPAEMYLGESLTSWRFTQCMQRTTDTRRLALLRSEPGGRYKYTHFPPTGCPSGARSGDAMVLARFVTVFPIPECLLLTGKCSTTAHPLIVFAS